MNKKTTFTVQKVFQSYKSSSVTKPIRFTQLFCFLSNIIINCQEQLSRQYNKLEKRKPALPFWEFALCHSLLYGTQFLNKTSLSKSFCLLRLGFQKAIYDASKFFLVLAFFGAFEMTAHVK